MSFLKIISFFISISVVCSCGPAILFTSPQPLGAEPSNEMPIKFIGKYRADASKFKEDEEKANDIPYWYSPTLEITKDSISFDEYRNESISSDMLDSMNYELRDGFLYLDNEKISLFPVYFDDGIYYFATKKESFHFPLKKSILSSFDSLDNKFPAGLFLESFVVVKEDYFVINIGTSENPPKWICVYFEMVSDNQLEIKLPFNSELDIEVLKRDAHVIEESPDVLIEAKSEDDFLKIVNNFFGNSLHFKKIEN